MNEEKDTIIDGEIVDDIIHQKEKTILKIKLKSLLFSTTLSLCFIAFLVLGITLNAWHPAWILFLVPFVVPDTFDAIANKNLFKLPIIMLVLIIYFFLIFVINLPPHPWWCIFFVIPIWSIVEQCVTEYKNIKKFK